MKSPLTIAVIAVTPLSCALAQQTPSATTPTPVNLALNKKYVTSDPNVSDWGGGLTDGSWEPARTHTFATGMSKTFPKMVTVDLETPGALGYVGIGVPGFGSTKTVTLSLSLDGQKYTDLGSYVFTQKKEETHLFSFTPTAARYVRLTYLDYYAESVNYPPSHAFTTEVVAYAPGVAPTLPPTYPLLPFQPADVAAPKLDRNGTINSGFANQHQEFLDRIKQGPIDLLFVGDSITNGWRTRGKEVWATYYDKYRPANFGIGGDRTQHVLWRFDQGELDIHPNPKVVVVMIGTNNSGYPAEDIVKGDMKIVSEIHRRLPDSKVLLLAIFPRAAKANDPLRAKLAGVNAELAKLDDGNKTRYLDFGAKFLDANGDLPKEIMPDYLHPNAAGYKIWAEAMQPLLEEMMK